MSKLCLLPWLFFSCMGCWPGGEDSWRHYTSGGHYPARTPSMSPDGSIIAFSSPRSGNGDIYQLNSDGSQPIRLTSDPGFETDPIFSPDGSIIAFTREAAGCRHLWLMNPDGTNQKQLSFGNVLDDIQGFSPDGTELLFKQSPSLSLGKGRLVEYFVMNLRTKKKRKPAGRLEYSPDGKNIAYSSSQEVWIADADGSNRRWLTTGYSPHFSMEGNTILYLSQADQPGSLWKMIDIDGSNDRPIGQMDDPVFASDGKHIVFKSPSWQRELWKMDLDGSNPTRLIAPVGFIDSLRPCRNGFVLKLVTEDRVGDIYVIDTTAWTVRWIASMK